MAITSPDGGVVSVDLAQLARAGLTRKPAWSHQSEDLNVNLVVLGSGDGVAAHVNTEVDVAMVGISGDGTVTVDEAVFGLAAGQIIIVPKGARRAIMAGEPGMSYLTCHRRRRGLWPTSGRQVAAHPDRPCRAATDRRSDGCPVGSPPRRGFSRLGHRP